MNFLQSRTFLKPNLFICVNILQYMSKLFGISYYKNGFGFNYDTAIFTLVMIWFGGCSLGTGLCWVGCNVKVANKKIILLLLGIRLIQAGLLICIIKFRCSKQQVTQILHLHNRLNEKDAGFVSVKHHRRNFIISMVFFVWLVKKVVQLIDINNKEKYRKSNTPSYIFKYVCTYMSTWPLTILGWQFLVWMQVFSSCLKVSLDELRSALIQSQEAPCTKHELQIFESVSQVKAVLKFKEKILSVYGLSIVFCQLRASLWIILNGYWYLYEKYRAKVVFLVSVFVFNVTMSYLPHWIGQEIASEGSEMLYDVLKSQVMREPLILNKRYLIIKVSFICLSQFSNLLFGLLHKNLKFRVFNLFDLTHRQFLSFLSISIGFLIIQLQMIV